MDTCKICGAPRDPLAASCKFCSTAYKLEKVSGETYIQALQTILNTIGFESTTAQKNVSTSGELLGSRISIQQTFDQRMVGAISTFAMPADAESLLQFFSFCHGNAQMAASFGNHSALALQNAWFGKSKMAYSQLKMKAVSQPEIAAFISEYEPLYGVSAKPPMSWKTKTLLVSGGMLLLLIVACIVMGILFDKK
jgi:hypothetical protein